jgi:hypothetical protein
MRVIFKSHWHPNSNGTEYTDVLGIYPDLGEQAQKDANQAAWDRYEEMSEEEQEEDGVEDEGPYVIIEEYDPEIHDGERAGGGSFEDEFAEIEKAFIA